MTDKYYIQRICYGKPSSELSLARFYELRGEVLFSEGHYTGREVRDISIGENNGEGIGLLKHIKRKD